MRDRLIELLKTVPRNTRAFYDQFADYLLKNGVIVPPVRIRTKVYKIVLGKIYEYEIVSYTIDSDGFSFIHLAYTKDFTIYGATHSIEEFNKQYYLTKEQAEQALKERYKE